MMGARVVVFDGDCGLCNGFVSWLIVHDQEGQFRVTGSAGELGVRAVALAGLDADTTRSSIVLYHDGAAMTRSDAVIAIVGSLGFPWSLARVARVAPRSLRDRVYGVVASRRRGTEAAEPACGIPPAHLVALWRSRLATQEDLPEVPQKRQGLPRKREP